MEPESDDCLECRLTSGFGVIGGGAYVAYHARKQSSVGRIVLGVISVGLCGLGLCRLFQLPPFPSKRRNPNPPIH
ncbi:unnamed protein product [Allacma fusca]|uniref:Distal membrane-arm assembly complex protein 1-like domain-containing protein n=1 Tax=Allacma fusca TaxID=39272 RepID=A0A8J2LHI4_9HEXA|nr:unnamed protein product [Allacma fusca]